MCARLFLSRRQLVFFRRRPASFLPADRRCSAAAAMDTRNYSNGNVCRRACDEEILLKRTLRPDYTRSPSLFYFYRRVNGMGLRFPADRSGHSSRSLIGFSSARFFGQRFPSDIVPRSIDAVRFARRFARVYVCIYRRPAQRLLCRSKAISIMAARRFTGYRGLQCLSWHGFCLPMADWSRALAPRILAFGQSGLAFGVSGRASVIDILFEVEV